MFEWDPTGVKLAEEIVDREDEKGGLLKTSSWDMDGSISLTGARVRRMEGILSEAPLVQVKVGGREYAQNHQHQRTWDHHSSACYVSQPHQ